MRHRKAKFLLNRFTSWRKATLVSLAKNLLIHQSIRTTLAKASATKPFVDKLISLARDNSLAAKRQAYKILGDHKLVSLLFNDIALRFTNRTGGYTRILRLGQRRGDNAQLVILELTEIKKKERKKPKKEKEKEIKVPEEKKPEEIKEKLVEEKKPQAEVAVKEKPPITKKPTKKFLGGLRKIFKKERDSL
jgi:large subunit ribosomal protein L17